MAIDTGIPAKQRAAIANGLSRLLADTYVLYLKTHSSTGTWKAPCSRRCTRCSGTSTRRPGNAIDPIAERIRALGHYAPGSYKHRGAGDREGDGGRDEGREDGVAS